MYLYTLYLYRKVSAKLDVICYPGYNNIIHRICINLKPSRRYILLCLYFFCKGKSLKILRKKNGKERWTRLKHINILRYRSCMHKFNFNLFQFLKIKFDFVMVVLYIYKVLFNASHMFTFMHNEFILLQ